MNYFTVRKEEPMELVYMDGKKEPYTTSSIIAECAGIKHHAIAEGARKAKKKNTA